MGLSGEQENACLKENDLVLNKQQDVEGGEGQQSHRDQKLAGTQESGTK